MGSGSSDKIKGVVNDDHDELERKHAERISSQERKKLLDF